MLPYSRRFTAGTHGLSPTDFYLEIDSTDGEVIIILPPIKIYNAVKAQTGSYHQTINYIFQDSLNSSGTHNIIFRPDPSDTINKADEFIVNIDGSGGTILITGKNQWTFFSGLSTGDKGASSVLLSYIAGENIGSPRVINIKSGKAYLYDKDSDDDAYSIVGVSKNSVNINDSVHVVLTGIIESVGSFVQDVTYYAGNNGVLTSTPPNSGVVLKIGHAETNDKLIISAAPPVINA